MVPPNPTREFWENIPPPIQRGIRELGFGLLNLAGLHSPPEPWEHDPIFLGQALVITLRASNDHRASPTGRPRFGARQLQEIGDWVRNIMAYCWRERVFPDLLSTFENSVVMNTTQKIHGQLSEALHPQLIRGLEHMLADYRRMMRVEVDSPGEMKGLGSFLGLSLAKGCLALLLFAEQHGLLEDGEYSVLDARLAEAKWFAANLKGQSEEGIQLKGFQEGEALLARNRTLRGLIEQIRHEYGDAHPMVQGFEEQFFRGRLTSEEQIAWDRLLDLIEAFLTNQH